jgi:hypothetical protein
VLRPGATKWQWAPRAAAKMPAVMGIRTQTCEFETIGVGLGPQAVVLAEAKSFLVANTATRPDQPRKSRRMLLTLSVHHCLGPKPPLPCPSPFPPRHHLVSKRGAKCGGVTERLKELAWKASEGQKPSGGSNPPLSAIIHTAREGEACRVPSKGAA